MLPTVPELGATLSLPDTEQAALVAGRCSSAITSNSRCQPRTGHRCAQPRRGPMAAPAGQVLPHFVSGYLLQGKGCRPSCAASPLTHQGNNAARRTTIWDQCGADHASQTRARSLECAMEGWHDDWVALPGDWTSTDPGGLHQQPVLVPSLWGGSGPRHPRDAQSPRCVTPTYHAVSVRPITRTSSAATPAHAVRTTRDGATPGSFAAWWSVNSAAPPADVA
jgi:hypothetical protein